MEIAKASNQYKIERDWYYKKCIELKRENLTLLNRLIPKNNTTVGTCEICKRTILYRNIEKIETHFNECDKNDAKNEENEPNLKSKQIEQNYGENDDQEEQVYFLKLKQLELQRSKSAPLKTENETLPAWAKTELTVNGQKEIDLKRIEILQSDDLQPDLTLLSPFSNGSLNSHNKFRMKKNRKQHLNINTQANTFGDKDSFSPKSASRLMALSASISPKSSKSFRSKSNNGPISENHANNLNDRSKLKLPDIYKSKWR